MARLQLRIVDVALLLAFCAVVHCALAGEQRAMFSKREWTLSRYYCPAGCSAPTKAFLKGYIGSAVVLSPDEFHAAFLDGCEGTVRIDVQSRSSSLAVKEIRNTLPPARRAPLEILHLPKKLIESGVVFCKEGSTESPMARLISIESERILIPFEDASFIELR